MQKSESIAKLAIALIAAQKVMPTIRKDSENPHFKSKFASLDGILELVRPVLANCGLSVAQGAASPVTDVDGKVTGFTGETMLIHESGEWLMSTVVMPLAKSDPQGMGSALTYFRRYSISAILSLSTEEDDDANTASTPSHPAPSRVPENRVMPFGKDDVKGKMLGDIPTEKLASALSWCKERDPKKFKDLIDSIEAVLENRRDELAA